MNYNYLSKVVISFLLSAQILLDLILEMAKT